MVKCFVFICENVTGLCDTGGLMFESLLFGVRSKLMCTRIKGRSVVFHRQGYRSDRVSIITLETKGREADVIRSQSLHGLSRAGFVGNAYFNGNIVSAY